MNPFAMPTPGFAECVFAQETPAVIYDLPRLRRDAALLQEFCDPFGTCCFAVKANRQPRVLAELAAAGFGADVASATEFALAVQAGLSPIVATAPGLTNDLVRQISAVDGTVFFDHLEQARAAARAGVDLRNHGLRIAVPGDYSNFGFDGQAEVAAFVEELGVVPRRFHFHCGEVETCERLVEILSFVRSCVSVFEVTEIDLGGGYGVLSNDIDAMHRAFCILREFAAEHAVRLIFEFGKVVAARCGTLVAGVVARKVRDGRQVVVLDTSSFNLGSLERRRFWKSSAYGEGIPTRIIGSSCFEGDVFIGDEAVPPLSPGDKVAFSQFGAYTMSIAGSIHGLDLPREVFFDG
jgi:diaminopimelate decarboxylase